MSGGQALVPRGTGRSTLAAFTDRLARDDLFILAAAISYAAILSVFPLLIGVIALLALIVDQPQAQQAAVTALQPYLPPEALAPVRDAISAVVRTRSTAGTLASLGLLWSATTVASSLRHALNRVLGAERSRGFWRRKLVELTMVVLAGTFISLSVLVPLAQAAVKALPPLEPLVEMLRWVRGASTIAGSTSWMFSAVAFFIVYRFLPNVRMGWRGLLAGTATAVVLFEATRRAFFWYVRTLPTYPLIYGPLAGLIVFMVWVYLVVVLVLLGAEVMRLIEPQNAEVSSSIRA